MVKKYTFFLGLNDKDTKVQKFTIEYALENVMEMVATQLGGGTVSVCSGVFKHEDGTIVKENSIKIETLGFHPESEYTKFANKLKLKYNQESVLMEASEVDAKFI